MRSVALAFHVRTRPQVVAERKASRFEKQLQMYRSAVADSRQEEAKSFGFWADRK
jgi:hypothetical protein